MSVSVHANESDAPLRYLALGDSYTIGESVPESGRWPVQLAAGLRAHGIALAPPRIVAATGWTTDELSAAMDAAGLDPPYDLVSLLIGVNNQYRGRSVEDYRGEFAELLARAIGLAGNRPGRVLVLAIPDWGVTPFGHGSGRDTAQVARELDAYNATARAIAEARGVAFVDIAPVSRARGAQKPMVAADGLHPSAQMYAQWTDQALPVARRLLEPAPEE
ncbi:MAG TPA: SGNH/GDSL hydrolase family protein [Xanthomonadaceae bacterium]|nr:SGNH/GDSL hydrolase family protein [Xanthomonadaceae bacterium]